MSKKKIAFAILVVLLGIMINIGIVKYQRPINENNVKVDITLESNKGNDFQVFYLLDGQDMPADFSAEQSSLATYNEINNEENLTFKVPAGAKWIRLDFGSTSAKTKISNMKFEYFNRMVEVAGADLPDVLRENDIESIDKNENGMTVMSCDGDPYIIFATEELDVSAMVLDANRVVYTILKVIVCLIIDIIFLLVIKNARKVCILPKELWQNRKLIWSLSKNDFKTKFAGSYLGIIWAFVQPIVTVLVYWFVFEKGLKAGGINTHSGIQVPFVLWLVAGLVPWFFFQDALNGGTNALIEYSYLVKKVVFKISILPIVKVMSALFVHVFFVLFTLVLYLAYGYYPDLYTLQIFYYTFCVFAFVLAISYFTCSVVVFFRDLTQIINIILQIGMWMTPIMWNIDAMELPNFLIVIFKLNPLYYIVAGYRDALINKVWFWNTPGLTMYFWIFTILLLGIGTGVFRKLRVHFADVL